MRYFSFIILFSFLVVFKTKAQSPEIQPESLPAGVCISFNNNGGSESYIYELTPTTDITIVGWSVKGDIAIVSESGNTVTIESQSTQAGRPPYGKGRIICHYTVDTIPVVCGPREVYLDVYKEFTTSDPIVGPTCVAEGDTVTYSINSLVSVNLNAEIGLDSYSWEYPAGWSPIYYSGDSSSITFSINAVDGEDTLIVGIGQCNSNTHVLITGQGTPTPDVVITPPSCISTDLSTAKVKINPDAGITYWWELSNPAWNYTSGTNANSQDSVIVNIGTSAGTITLYATGGCDTISKTFTINRSLGKRTSISGDTCVDRDNDHVYSISPFPNTEIEWSVPTGWTIDPNNPNSQIVTITAGASAMSGYIIANTISCPGEKDSLYVNVRPATPAPLSGETDLTRCDVSELTYTVSAVDNADGYGWIFPDGWSLSSTITAGTSVDVTPDGVSSGYVQAYALGCINSDTLSLLVTYDTLEAPDAIISSSSCANAGLKDTITFEIDNPVMGVPYGWGLPSGWTVIASSGSDSTLLIVETDGINGNYTIGAWAKDACGTSDTITTSINISALNYSIEPDDQGAFTIFSADPDPVPNAAYYWWYDNENDLIFDGASQTSAVIIGDPDYPICLNVESSITGCITRRCLDGEEALRRSSNTMLNETSSNVEKVSLYPNPAKDVLNFNFESLNGLTHDIQLLDIKGNVITELQSTTDSATLNISKLKSGSYFAVISSEVGITVKQVHIAE